MTTRTSGYAAVNMRKAKASYVDYRRHTRNLVLFCNELLSYGYRRELDTR